MAKACIINYNNRGSALLKKLKSEGRIANYWNVAGTPRWCFEFTGTLTIDITDYMDVSPGEIRTQGQVERLKQEFKKAVVLPIVNSLSGGEVLGFTDGHIEVEDTSKQEIVCVKMSKAEKERLVREAEEQNITVSELIRRKVFPT